MNSGRFSKRRLSALVAAILLPAVLTAILLLLNPGNPQNFIYLYLGVVAVLGVVSGMGAALVAAGESFLLLDYLFVPPIHTLQFASGTDLINLSVFVGAAGLVGTVGSLRRNAQLRAQALASELQTANIELARLAVAERQMRELEETDRLRREVLAEISHELRTPLASILTGSTAILNRESLAPDLRTDVSLLASAARRLNRLVSDILDLNRIETGSIKLHCDDTDLGEAFNAAVSRAHLRNPERQIVIQLAGEPIEVLADWDRLGQILDNLLENAEHAAPAGSPITVAATKSATQATIKVIDEGPGIPPELREQVFKRFIRAQTDGHRTGMGLGLTIVRGLVEAHGGKIWVGEGTTRHGTTMVFTLPLVTDV